MATAKPDTGHGATLTLSVNTGSYKIRRIKLFKESVPVVDISHLGTTGPREVMPGDLTKIDFMEVTILFEAVTGLPALAGVETVTTTFPLQASGATTAANIAGTGFVVDRTWPELNSDNEMISVVSIQMNGDTGPTYTAAS